ncbi:hypothetical protein H696_02780 [Fonticula alba]|uniref:Uncharacterized protein n=1 Tax=Fonticula alba TaxID=691883 RepID=A0A058ZA72_FONAL|nr:hypothetical protein H696_02780 [Fonticula alba]KCV70437.1 hypothetical protein H696_02780 [Fonticula alba]|eukprot:XP_009494953.1 hypothetical protein H696_02780 [Fonticula alba]
MPTSSPGRPAQSADVLDHRQASRLIRYLEQSAEGTTASPITRLSILNQPTLDVSQLFEICRLAGSVRGLRELQISGCDLQDDDVRHLAPAFGRHPCLEWISLANNSHLTDASGHALISKDALSMSDSIEHVAVEGTGIRGRLVSILGSSIWRSFCGFSQGDTSIHPGSPEPSPSRPGAPPAPVMCGEALLLSAYIFATMEECTITESVFSTVDRALRGFRGSTLYLRTRLTHFSSEELFLRFLSSLRWVTLHGGPEGRGARIVLYHGVVHENSLDALDDSLLRGLNRLVIYPFTVSITELQRFSKRSAAIPSLPIQLAGVCGGPPTVHEHALLQLFPGPHTPLSDKPGPPGCRLTPLDSPDLLVGRLAGAADAVKGEGTPTRMGPSSGLAAGRLSQGSGDIRLASSIAEPMSPEVFLEYAHRAPALPPATPSAIGEHIRRMVEQIQSCNTARKHLVLRCELLAQRRHECLSSELDRVLAGDAHARAAFQASAIEYTRAMVEAQQAETAILAVVRELFSWLWSDERLSAGREGLRAFLRAGCESLAGSLDPSTSAASEGHLPSSSSSSSSSSAMGGSALSEVSFLWLIDRGFKGKTAQQILGRGPMSLARALWQWDTIEVARELGLPHAEAAHLQVLLAREVCGLAGPGRASIYFWDHSRLYDEWLCPDLSSDIGRRHEEAPAPGRRPGPSSGLRSQAIGKRLLQALHPSVLPRARHFSGLLFAGLSMRFCQEALDLGPVEAVTLVHSAMRFVRAHTSGGRAGNPSPPASPRKRFRPVLEVALPEDGPDTGEQVVTVSSPRPARREASPRPAEEDGFFPPAARRPPPAMEGAGQRAPEAEAAEEEGFRISIQLGTGLAGGSSTSLVEDCIQVSDSGTVQASLLKVGPDLAGSVAATEDPTEGVVPVSAVELAADESTAFLGPSSTGIGEAGQSGSPIPMAAVPSPEDGGSPSRVADPLASSSARGMARPSSPGTLIPEPEWLAGGCFATDRPVAVSFGRYLI